MCGLKYAPGFIRMHDCVCMHVLSSKSVHELVVRYDYYVCQGSGKEHSYAISEGLIKMSDAPSANRGESVWRN